MKIIQDAVDILSLLYGHGWDERNGGNLSMILDERDVLSVKNPIAFERMIEMSFDMTPLIGKYLMITATGSYFKNARKQPEKTLGIVQVVSAHQLGLIWGFEDGGRPTSESPTHLKSHIERLKVDSTHRVVIHCHPTHLIAMTHIEPLDDNHWTRILWKMQTESLVVFPEGVGILPWILCGGEEIGNQTANKMKSYRSVVWAHHGLFATGMNLDETFGLVETIEKACEIYLKIKSYPIQQSITNEELLVLAHAFHVTPKPGVID